jgi:ATP-dependent helicase HrpB
VRSLGAWLPELALPAFEEAELIALLPEFARGSRSLAELARRDLAAFLRARLTSEQQRALDREAPESLSVPSGSRIRLVYEPGRPPVLAARIQELFGLSASPRVARGRVGVLLHLLAPNHRPQQVTDDLASFWNGAYHTIKAELRRRYPRHAWPDDPWSATPERRPRRRGS